MSVSYKSRCEQLTKELDQARDIVTELQMKLIRSYEQAMATSVVRDIHVGEGATVYFKEQR